MTSLVSNNWTQTNSTPAEVGNILSLKSIMKYFFTVVLSLPLIQEGELSVFDEGMCTILVNRLED